MKKSKYCVMDTETTGLYPEMGHRPFLFGFHFYDEKFKSVKMIKTYDINEARELCKTPDIKIFHNAKFDLKMYHACGIKVNGEIEDTFILAKLYPKDFFKYELESLVKVLFQIEDNEKVTLKEWLSRETKRRKDDWKEWNAPYEVDFPDYLLPNYSDIPKDIMLPYFDKDLTNPMLLYKYFKPTVNERLAVAYKREIDLMLSLVESESRGHLIDKEYLLEQKALLEKELDSLNKKFSVYNREYLQETGEVFNPASNKALSWLVFKKLKLPILKYTEGGKNPALDESVLEEYERPELKPVLEFRYKSKMLSTYIDGILNMLDPDNCVHTRFNQLQAATGRFSSTEPNLQNIPREGDINIRRAFICRPGYTNFYLDYSQIEVRLFAVYSGDPVLQRFIKEGQDPHQSVADICGIARKPAKQIQFGVLYGMGRKALLLKFIELGVEDHEFGREFRKVALKYDELMEAGDKRAAMDLIASWWKKSKAAGMLEAYYQNFPTIKRFKVDVRDAILKRGREEGQGYITTWGGRMNLLSDQTAYKGINYIIQGSAADIIKESMVKVSQFLKNKKSKILMTIHDELVIEVPKDELNLIPKIKAIMEDFELDVPIAVDIQYTKTSWKDKKPFTK